MYRVLIVDDEPRVRRGLRGCVNWRAMDMEVCGEAPNGREAMELVKRLEPDVVLSDVRMPFMDGIELCRALNERYPGIQVVLISGYSDLDYLKSALRMGVVNYILKPVNLQELQETLGRIARRMMDQSARDEERRRLNEKLRESMPLLRERFLQRLLRGEIQDEQAAGQRAAFLELDLPVRARYGLVGVRLHPEAPDEAGREMLMLQARERMGEWVRLHQGAHMAQMGENELALFWALDGEASGVADRAGEILELLRGQGDLKAAVGLGAEAWGLLNLGNGYRVARQALSRYYFEGQELVLSADPAAYRAPETEMGVQGLKDALRRGEQEAFFALLQRYFAALKGAAQAQQARVQLRQLPLMGLSMLLEMEEGGEHLTGRAVELIESLSQSETLDGARERVEGFYRELFGFLAERRSSYKRQLVEQIRAQVERDCAHNPTIQEIADRVNYSAAYIACLFKQEMGQTIGEYATQCRIRLAGRLLADSNLKTYQVAERVGYQDVKYFSRLFRKQTGLTPSEYREGRRGEGA